jgi:hypothetical protein
MAVRYSKVSVSCCNVTDFMVTDANNASTDTNNTSTDAYNAATDADFTVPNSFLDVIFTEFDFSS